MLRVLPLVLLSGCSLLTTLSEPIGATDASDAGLADAASVADAALETSTSDAAVDAGAPSIRFVQSISSAATTTLSLTKPVLAGSLLVVAIATNDSGTDPISGVSDSLNGAWKRALSSAYQDGHVELYYVSNSLAGEDTVTAAGSGAIVVAEYSGVAKADPLDQIAGSAGSNTTAFSAGPTAMLIGSNELVLGIGGETAAGTRFLPGSGFVLRDQAAASFDYQVALEDRIATTSSGAVMTMTGAKNYYGTVVAVFKTP